MASFKCADGLQHTNTNGWRYQWKCPPIKEGLALSRYEADTLVMGFKQRGVNMLALGFDNTLVHVHTALNRNALDGPNTFAAWGGDATQLSKYIRPIFRSLISSATRHGLHVAVVTLCDQTDLLRQLIEIVSPDTEIILRSGHSIPGVEHHLVPQGKTRHIERCIEYIRSLSGHELKTSEVLLVDDDPDTIQIAADAGCQVAWLPTSLPNVVKTSKLFDGNENKWCENYLLQTLRIQYNNNIR